jgi:hypothetical protein
MGKKLMVVVAICAAFVVAAGTASANTPSITYTGQGMDANGPTTQNCGAAADDGGTGLGIPASGQYLLWVLNGVDSSVTSVTLHLPDGEHPMVKVGNTWKYVSNVFTRADLIAFPAHAGWDGIQAANNLVVSHGCTQGAVDSHTSTEIHKAGGHDPVTGALDLGSSVHDSATIAVDNNVPIPANSTASSRSTRAAATAP